jgi:ferredoxin-NADP reductase
LKRGFLVPHPFSFSAAPNNRFLKISVKASGDYTAMFGALPIGTPVMIDGPLGVFTEKMCVTGKYLFIAGGIGITPIRTLAETLAAKNADHALLYAARTADELAFEKDLRMLVPRSIFVLSQGKEPGYRNGRIDKALIMELTPDIAQRDVYLCGPAGMMLAVRNALKEIGVPAAQIHFEDFSY